MSDSPLNDALRQFEAVEANLNKAEKVWAQIEGVIPDGVLFGSDPNYESLCRNLETLLASLPSIDGWQPDIVLLEFGEIAQSRFDAQEAGDIESISAVEDQIEMPARLLREYRYRFNQKRRELIREALNQLIDSIDAALRDLNKLLLNGKTKIPHKSKEFDQLKHDVDQINTLLGSSVAKPSGWVDLQRHLHFGTKVDFDDILKRDWPSVKDGLRKSMYGENEPVPVQVNDLAVLVRGRPSGPVATKLLWGKLGDEEFERLIFSLISSEAGYENPEWLMKTNAADRGRDLSVVRVQTDSLAGTVRQRVIIQCKHWQSKSISPIEIAVLKEQLKIWEPPRVDVCVIATSGRFTSDAVASVERNNQSDTALRIEMWPESHLERLLASRPAIIAEFSLR